MQSVGGFRPVSLSACSPQREAAIPNLPPPKYSICSPCSLPPTPPHPHSAPSVSPDHYLARGLLRRLVAVHAVFFLSRLQLLLLLRLCPPQPMLLR